MNMFLSSSFADVLDLFKEFASEDLVGKSVTFIPTASHVEEITHYVEAAKSAFSSLGIVVDMLEVSNSPFSAIRDKLNKNDFIYVSGGNTFFLLQELRKSGADQLIIEQIHKGKLYIGESAGTIIMAPSITYIEHMDDKAKGTSLSDNKGLHLIEGYPVPHVGHVYFNESVEQIIEKYQSSLHLLLLSNKQAILVTGTDVTLKG
ncbi:Type 1 glutamine amidotransferase-like domain-containing protein [Alkalicoccobacillus gibsonii]|uniref:Type 1 glutamine amidotransferase-like domain-containing protein n=1 Tax=Alkalicoccobacillus gibsonii TaxID=79881 RepID=UPI003510EF84